METHTHLDGEIWKLAPDTEGRYEVSNLGRVRSLVVGCQHGTLPRKKPLLMSPYNNKTDGTGYLVVNLRVGGKVQCRCVSELILTAFVGPRPSPDHQAAHLDGKKLRNELDNLAWVTTKENASHRRLHGTQHERPMHVINGVESYQCSNCDEWLPRAGFHSNKSPSSRCGIQSWCRECSNAARMARKRKTHRTALLTL